MNKMLLFLIPLFLLACDNDYSESDAINYSVSVTGNCEFITIDNQLDDQCYIIYHGLPVAYTVPGVTYSDGSVDILYKIAKHINDASTVTAEISVDGVIVESETTSAPYGEIIISHSI